jgi:8-oxo-dGTP diphosphatase
VAYAHLTMNPTLRRVLLPIAKIYWKVLRPATYGVKVVIVHPEVPRTCLLVRHSYGDQALWNLPGGGYDPRREDPLAAATREVREELSLDPATVTKLGEYTTTAEGKRDTVSIVRMRPTSADLRVSGELAEAHWISLDDMGNRGGMARVVRYALELTG